MLPKEISNMQMNAIVPNRSRDGFLFFLHSIAAMEIATFDNLGSVIKSLNKEQ